MARGERRLHEVECPDADDDLRTALHHQLAADVVNMPLDRVHAQHQAVGNLAPGQRFGRLAAVRRGGREIQGVLLAKGGGESQVTRANRTSIASTSHMKKGND